MSDSEADPELLELLRQSLGLSSRPRDEISDDTGVLKDAEFIYNNAIDVSIDMHGTKAAAQSISTAMQERAYSTRTWGQHDLHPTPDDGFSHVDILNFVFTLDLLNFSFWSELSESERFQVEYKGKRWTGYWSLVACLRRALEDNIPVTTPRFWLDQRCSDDLLKHVFRSATAEEIPLLSVRIDILREAGQVLMESFGDDEIRPVRGGMHDTRHGDDDHHDTSVDHGPIQPTTGSIDDANTKTADTETLPTSEVTKIDETTVDTSNDVASTGTEQPKLREQLEVRLKPDMSVARIVEKANHSAGKLVNILVKHFPNFRDETRFDGRKVRLYKRAQIFVADLWAALNGSGHGEFHDIDHLTMFADYRIPQMLRSLGVLIYSPPLEYAIRDRKLIAPGHSWEVQLRGCSIWAVELIRREIVRRRADGTGINAVLVDFFLYDLAKEKEASGEYFIPTEYLGRHEVSCGGDGEHETALTTPVPI